MAAASGRAAWPASRLLQAQAGLSTEATRSMALAAIPSAPRSMLPGVAEPSGPLPTLCALWVSRRAEPPVYTSPELGSAGLNN